MRNRANRFAALHMSAHGTTRARRSAEVKSVDWGEADLMRETR
jgi:hypothetical protein